MILTFFKNIFVSFKVFFFPRKSKPRTVVSELSFRQEMDKNFKESKQTKEMYVMECEFYNNHCRPGFQRLIESGYNYEGAYINSYMTISELSIYYGVAESIIKDTWIKKDDSPIPKRNFKQAENDPDDWRFKFIHACDYWRSFCWRDLSQFP